MTAIFAPRTLGRSGLTVSAVGIGGGSMIQAADVLHAVDHGINFLFYSTDLHHFLYESMAPAVQQLCRAGSSRRDEVVLALVTYVKEPDQVTGVLFDQFAELRIDHVDLFMWGWMIEGSRPRPEDLSPLSKRLRNPASDEAAFVESIVGASERLKRFGIARSFGLSFHDVAMARRYADIPEVDVIMVRHNCAHRSARKAVLEPLARDPRRPGVMTFKSQVSRGGPLALAPSGFPAHLWRPQHGDFYRYSLSTPPVDLCLSGPTSRAEVDALIASVRRGPLTPDEMEYLEVYGDIHRGTRPIDDIRLTRLGQMAAPDLATSFDALHGGPPPASVVSERGIPRH
jgi:aryl-alcohol dehydrogenase-like predicted oxidoreductase